MRINLEVPYNSLSFGHCAVGISRCLIDQGVEFDAFPVGGTVDFGVYDKLPDNYKNYIVSSAQSAIGKYNKNNISLKLWHLSGSHSRIGHKQILLSYHELDSLTPWEINVANQQEAIILTSEFSKQVFINSGVTTPIYVVHYGYDNLHYKRLDKEFYSDKSIVFSIFGKMEFRKKQERVIKLWCKKYGNNPLYRLHIHCFNPFLKDQMNNIYARCFEGRPAPFNVKLYDFQPLDSLMNECYNVCGIVLDLSGGESISLPSLCCTALGKHNVVLNSHALKEWANPENSTLVQPNGKEPCIDGIFFHPNSPYNCGNIYTWSDEDLLKAFDSAIERYKQNPRNVEGEKLQEEYSFENGTRKIIEILKSI